MRGRSCLFWCLQLILFSFAPISGSFVALVLAASLQFSLFLVFVVIVDGFWFRLVNVRPVVSLFWIVCYLYQWSSYSQPSKLLLCEAIISFNFSFDANVVSNIADIMINIEIIINIADRGKKRCRIRTPEGLRFRGKVCGQSLVYFGSSVIYINGVHIRNRQNYYYCAGAIISFNFSFL